MLAGNRKENMGRIEGDQLDEFEERAAIMEFEGKICRELAERYAWQRVIEKHAAKNAEKEAGTGEGKPLDRSDKRADSVRDDPQ